MVERIPTGEVTMKTKVIQNHADHPGSGAQADAVIRTVGFSKRFGEVEALHPLDLEVPHHSIFGFLGPNGAGKTTTIKLLLGLGKPTAGQAAIFGLDSVRDSLAIRARVGYLAQDPRFYPHMTARETLGFTARFFYRWGSRALRDRIDETLELVGLADKADRPVRGFSGGERQRLGIAQAQVNHPDLLILDEPAASLDPLGRRDVLDLLARLRAHTTVFYSTHILDDVERVSDHVAILDRGKLVASAPTAELLDGDTVTYELTLRGNGEAAMRVLRAFSWVSDVTTVAQDSSTTLTLSVTDEKAAESLLLRSVLEDRDVTVMAFGRKHLNLEEAFLRLVEGGTR
jgi:ABC-2 type transport system ATP-binding protein